MVVGAVEGGLDKAVAFRRLAAACPDWLIEPLAAYQDAEAPDGALLHSAVPVSGALSVMMARGHDNHIFRGWRSSAKGGRIYFAGSRNIVFIGPHTRFNGADVRVIGDDNIFLFGGFSTVESMIVMLTGTGGRISIGQHCMLSARIIIDRSDHHAIYDSATGLRINEDRDVAIEDHVWISREVRVGKGVTIGRDAIVGQGAVVVGSLDAGTLNVGVPARAVRQGVTWSRMIAASLADMEASQRHRDDLQLVAGLISRIAQLRRASEPVTPDT
jgi:acetyltransferase-like isoleucine patch superfamily enzyme